jgi:hypothetical protein
MIQRRSDVRTVELSPGLFVGRGGLANVIRLAAEFPQRTRDANGNPNNSGDSDNHPGFHRRLSSEATHSVPPRYSIPIM